MYTAARSIALVGSAENAVVGAWRRGGVEAIATTAAELVTGRVTAIASNAGIARMHVATSLSVAGVCAVAENAIVARCTRRFELARCRTARRDAPVRWTVVALLTRFNNAVAANEGNTRSRGIAAPSGTRRPR